MAWSASVILDSDKVDVGTVTATFTAADLTTFTYSARARANLAGLNAFITAARAARDAWQTRVTAEASYSSTINAAFVTAGG